MILRFLENQENDGISVNFEKKNICVRIFQQLEPVEENYLIFKKKKK